MRSLRGKILQKWMISWGWLWIVWKSLSYGKMTCLPALRLYWNCKKDTWRYTYTNQSNILEGSTAVIKHKERTTWLHWSWEVMQSSGILDAHQDHCHVYQQWRQGKDWRCQKKIHRQGEWWRCDIIGSQTYFSFKWGHQWQFEKSYGRWGAPSAWIGVIWYCSQPLLAHE